MVTQHAAELAQHKHRHQEEMSLVSQTHLVEMNDRKAENQQMLIRMNEHSAENLDLKQQKYEQNGRAQLDMANTVHTNEQ